jgi:hypothetical protein
MMWKERCSLRRDVVGLSAMTLVEATPDASSPNRAARANVEHYGDETRETYLNRGDHLSFRVDNGVNEHRFFENGRTDKVKQVLENRQEQTRVVRYSLRQDGCTELARELDKAPTPPLTRLHLTEDLTALRPFAWP